MATNFPTSVDVLTNPVSNDSLNSPSHSAQHANANDAIEAVEGYLLTGAGNAGLVKLIPSGATNGTVAANGDVTIGSAVSLVTVTGVFSATYDNYLIKISGGVGSATADFQLRIGNATSAYNYTSIYNNFTTSTVLGLASASQGEIRYIGGITTTNLQMHCTVDSPFLTRPTIVHGSQVTATATGLTMETKAYLANNNSYADFNVAPSTGTLTGGTIRVYGYK